MDKELLIIGNWKMNLNPLEAAKYISEATSLVEEASKRNIVVGVAPTFLALTTAVYNAPEGLGIYAQNVNEHDHGAYTGEVSASMLKFANLTGAIIGHSERRQYNGETSKACNLKIKALLEQGLTPVYCVGESLETFEAGKTIEFVSEQLREGFAGLTAEEASQVVIAYEPIWAIGTGKSASIEIAEETAKQIRAILSDIFGEASSRIKILYGGSVKAENIGGYMACPNVDGALVGGASVDLESFTKVIKGAR